MQSVVPTKLPFFFFFLQTLFAYQQNKVGGISIGLEKVWPLGLQHPAPFSFFLLCS